MCWGLNDWKLRSLCQTYPLLTINVKESLHGHNEAEGIPDLSQRAPVFLACTRVPAPSAVSVGQCPGREGQGQCRSPLQAMGSIVEQEGLEK